jgi:DNA-binding NarL/FixJ family response regulator
MSVAPIRLLLVDDHLAFRQPLAFMFNREPGLSVVAQVGSLAEAREVISELGGTVDVALIDLQLPDGNGVELIRELRAICPQGRALVLTADTNRVHYAQALEATLASLTPRERQVLEALAQGLDNKAIADRLFISHDTARTHVVKLLAKLDVESRLQAAIFAIKNGLGSGD